MKKDKPMRIVDAEKVPGFILPELAQWAVDESAIMADDRSPFHGSLIDGDPRILLITGENASGKSLAFRLIAQLAQDHGVEALTLSIRERTGDGTFEMAHMRRAMIYGSETTSSTGAVSARVVQGGFHNLANRTQPALLGLDEPEIGLSDGYAEALGEYIGTQAKNLGGNACGVVVVTHSRRLAEGMVRGLGADPTMLAMLPKDAQECRSVAGWISSRETRSIDELLTLKDTSLERFRQMQAILKG